MLAVPQCGGLMGNKFVIGERVIRKMTETAHVIQDLKFKDSVETLHVATGEFKTVNGAWLYIVDGVPSWIVEDALMKMPDDWVDPNATTKKRDLVVEE